MRKLLLYIILPFLWGMTSCSEEEIMTYSEKDYILFSDYIKDSTNFSFLAYPTADQVEFKIPVQLIGMPSDKDRTYKVSVMTEESDAPADSYILQTEQVFRAGHTTDTCVIVFKKTEELKKISRRLVLRLEATDDFALGQTDRLAKIINITNKLYKPTWWNASVEKYWLGTYSDKKFELFLLANDGKLEVDVAGVYEIRSCTLKLKHYLQMQKEQGNTIREEDGTEMIVPYIG